ncbi:WXG100 family type VII secretion target [Nocardia thailandica]
MTEFYVDPDYVAAIENFDQLSHADIHAAVDRLDPAVLADGGRVFTGAGSEFGDAVARAHGEIRAAIADGWRGAAAERAAATVTAFEQAGQQITQVLTAVGQRLTQAGDAAEAIRAAVPAPSGDRPDPGAALLDPARAEANAAASRAAENARLDAVRVMDEVYAGTLLTTGSGVPAFVGLTGVPQAGLPAAPEIIVATANSDTAAPGGTAPGGETAADGPAPGATAPGAGGGAPHDGTQAAGTTGTDRLLTTGAPAATAGAGGTEPAARQGVPAVGSAPSGVSVPRSAPGAGAGPGAGSGLPGAVPGAGGRVGRTTAASTGEDRKDQAGSAGDTTSGLAAGAMGGMLGGALAVSDSARPAGQRPPAGAQDDEDDDFLHFTEEDLTYLEPADEENPLIGPLAPTTPAVVGEWTGRE